MTNPLGSELRSIRDAAVLFSAALLLGLLALTTLVAAGDRWVASQIRAARTGWVTTLSEAVATGTSFWVAVAVTLGTVLVLLLRRPRSGCPIRWVLSVMVGGWAAAVVLRWLIDRPRSPSGHWLVQAGSAGFPSGHVAFAAGCALAGYGLARNSRYRSAVVVAGTTAVTLVALSRMYLDVHYLSDILGALLAAVAVRSLADAVLPAGRIDPVSGTRLQP